MIIHPNRIPKYFHSLKFPFPIHHEVDNQVVEMATKERLTHLCSKGQVMGVGSWKRLRMVRQNKPVLASSSATISIARLDSASAAGSSCWYPIWDETGSYIISDDAGKEVWADEEEVRRLVKKQSLTIHRPMGSPADAVKVMLKTDETEVIPLALRRVDPVEPYCVAIRVGEGICHMHVAERCESHYDGRPMPYVRYDGHGKRHHTRSSPTLSSSAL